MSKLRQWEVLVGQGKSVAEAVRMILVTEPTYYRWRTEFGGLMLDQMKRLEELELENARLGIAAIRSQNCHAPSRAHACSFDSASYRG